MSIATNTCLTSLPILPEGGVEILAPLTIKSSLTAIDNAVVVGGEMSPNCFGLVVTNNSVMNGNLTVVGNLTVSGNVNVANPYWVAVVISYSGGIPVIPRNGGRNATSSLVRVSGNAAGFIQFDFPAQPNGFNI